MDEQIRTTMRTILGLTEGPQRHGQVKEPGVEQIKLLYSLVLARHPDVLAQAVDLGFSPTSSDAWMDLDAMVAGHLPSETVAKLRDSLPTRFPLGCLVGERRYCAKCKTALIECPDCYGTGKQTNGYECPRCLGTTLLCHVHGGDWQ